MLVGRVWVMLVCSACNMSDEEMGHVAERGWYILGR